MESLPGFISIPRLTGSSRTAGAFFFATVIAPSGPGQWKVNLEGKTVTVGSSLELTPGQNLKLKVVSQSGGRWLLQLVVPSSGADPKESRPAHETNSLAAAFFSRGLPAAAERLEVWTRWLASHGHGPIDRDAWAASLEARGEGPQGSLTRDVEPWMAWQAALESGKTPPPPDDERCWENWNLRKTPDGAPWLVMPLRWEYVGQTDSGLLQARWSPQGQRIDRWLLTAAPAETPFRLEATVLPERLDLIWRFFRPEQKAIWESRVSGPEFPRFSGQDLSVTLTVTGIELTPGEKALGRIDVKA